MPTAMAQGKIQIGLGGIPAVMKFVDKGSDFKILCPLNVDGDMLLMRPECPARDWAGFVSYVKKSPRPVKIGFKAPVAVAKIVFEKGCRAAGLTCRKSGQGAGPGEIELTNMNTAKNIIPGLLAKDGIDGAVINEPVGSLAVHRKAARIVHSPERIAAARHVESPPLLLRLRHGAGCEGTPAGPGGPVEVDPGRHGPDQPGSGRGGPNWPTSGRRWIWPWKR